MEQVVRVRPCLKYYFQIELKENEAILPDFTMESGVAEYVFFDLRNKKRNYRVTYYYDKSSDTLDLSRATVRFPRTAVTNLECIKRVEVAGRRMPKENKTMEIKEPGL